jgi:hypothetical protein
LQEAHDGGPNGEEWSEARKEENSNGKDGAVYSARPCARVAISAGSIALNGGRSRRHDRPIAESDLMLAIGAGPRYYGSLAGSISLASDYLTERAL